MSNISYPAIAAIIAACAAGWNISRGNVITSGLLTFVAVFAALSVGEPR